MGFVYVHKVPAHSDYVHTPFNESAVQYIVAAEIRSGRREDDEGAVLCSPLTSSLKNNKLLVPAVTSVKSYL